MESVHQKLQVKDHKKRDISNTEIYKSFEATGGVEYKPMINELRKRTHLPKWICEKVYDAEADILTDLGLIIN